MKLLCYACSLLTCLGLSVVECVSVVRNERGFAKVAIIHVGHSIAVLFYMGLAEKCFYYLALLPIVLICLWSIFLGVRSVSVYSHDLQHLQEKARIF
jgi:hypothetical protein